MSCFRERKLNTINVKREGHLISKGTEVGLNIKCCIDILCLIIGAVGSFSEK